MLAYTSPNSVLAENYVLYIQQHYCWPAQSKAFTLKIKLFQALLDARAGKLRVKIDIHVHHTSLVSTYLGLCCAGYKNDHFTDFLPCQQNSV